MNEQNLGLIIRDGKAVVSSRDVARVFEKEHKNVLKDIRELKVSSEFGRLNFEQSSYANEQNKEQPEYLMTRDGFTLLAMGYTGERAMKFKEAYIAAFNEMEQRLKTTLTIPEIVNNPQLLLELLTKHIETLQQNEQLKQIEAKYEGQTRTDGLYKIGEIAEEFGGSAIKLNDFLSEKRVQYKPNGSQTWRLYSEYVKDRYAIPRLVKLNNGYEKPMLLWTPKGRDFIHDIVEREQPEWYA
jgi:Rha family phage regulatory protein